MTPKSFLEIEFMCVTLETAKGDIECLFSELRVDLTTIPDGLIPYDIRYADHDDSNPAHIATFVAVNYFGTIIVKEPLDFGSSGYIEILDWNFDDEPDYCH